MLVMAPACSDDPKTPLETVEGNEANASYTTLTFDWDAVSGAVQYGYELYADGEDPIQTGVTQRTDVKFTDLTPGTEYTLKVWAYAAMDGSQTTSEPLILKAKTLDAGQLDTPALQLYEEGKYYNVYWNDVTDASSYTYDLTLEGETVESGTTNSPSLWFYDLAKGTYELKVQAISNQESILSSETAELAIDVNPVEIWRVSGTYTSGITGTSWKATLVAYSDNSYTIEAWYLAQGYNLDFYIDTLYPDNMFILPDTYEYNTTSYCYKVPTGRSDVPDVWVYPWYNYCSMTGDKDAGQIALQVYSKKYVYDYFTWGEETKDPADDYVGTWTMHSTYDSYLDYTAWNSVDESLSITAVKVNANTIRIPSILQDVANGGTDETMELVIDAEAKTVTIQPTLIWDWLEIAYKSLTSDQEYKPIVGTINDDGSISIPNWRGWYGTTYYVKNGTTTLTR